MAEGRSRDGRKARLIWDAVTSLADAARVLRGTKGLDPINLKSG
jgi:hypothetical protein